MNIAKVVQHNSAAIFEEIIVDHPKHGRIYAFMSCSHEAMSPTWRDGCAFFVKPTDTLETFEKMKETQLNASGVTAFESMCACYDADREMISWSGSAISKMLNAAIDANADKVA